MAAAATTPSVLCTICGDNAYAFNFGVLSCDSCKAFFRRATRSGKVPVCVFSGDCPVSLKTRRFCAACRLRKCERAGMNRRLVLSEEQRKARQRTIEENRLRKFVLHAGRLLPGSAEQQPAMCRMPPSVADSAGRSSTRTLPTTSSYGAPPPPQTTARLCRLGRQSRSGVCDDKDDEGEMGRPEPSHPVQGTSVCMLPFPGGFANSSMTGNCNESNSGCSPQNPDDALTSSTLHPSSLTSLPPQPLALRATSFKATSARRLSSQTYDMLDFLTRMYRLKLIASHKHSRPSSVCPTVASNIVAMAGQPRDQDAYSLVQHFVGRLSDLMSGFVLFSREVPDVARLPLDAQMALVKACAPTFVLVRAAELYDDARSAWVDELGDVVSVAVIDDLLCEVRCAPTFENPTAAVHCRRLFLEMLSAIKTQNLAIRGSLVGGAAQTAIAVLQAIALLSPELLPPGIVGQDALDALANAQQRHVYLLRQHIEATCSFEAAAELLPKLLCTLQTCKRAAQCLRGLLLSCDAVRGDELLAEILDARRPEQWVPSSLSYPSVMLANGELLPASLCRPGKEAAQLTQICSSSNSSSSENGPESSSCSSAYTVLGGAYDLLTFADNVTEFGIITGGH